MRHPREEFSLQDAVDFFRKSGLVPYIRGARVVRGCCNIEYRAIPAGINSSKHRDVIQPESPEYFRFVRDHTSAIIELVDDASTRGITLTSKNMQLTRNARDKFLQGWEVVKERYGIVEGPACDTSQASSLQNKT